MQGGRQIPGGAPHHCQPMADRILAPVQPPSDTGTNPDGQPRGQTRQRIPIPPPRCFSGEVENSRANRGSSAAENPETPSLCDCALRRKRLAPSRDRSQHPGECFDTCRSPCGLLQRRDRRHSRNLLVASPNRLPVHSVHNRFRGQYPVPVIRPTLGCGRVQPLHQPLRCLFNSTAPDKFLRERLPWHLHQVLSAFRFCNLHNFSRAPARGQNHFASQSASGYCDSGHYGRSAACNVSALYRMRRNHPLRPSLSARLA